ncbi:hypothetical protein [Roseovarius salis]|uniref:hypothetical protein n=1 Tax=Roseovarius salis TaxID=3376063 RepID=UPI0037CB2AD2
MKREHHRDGLRFAAVTIMAVTAAGPAGADMPMLPFFAFVRMSYWLRCWSRPWR